MPQSPPSLVVIAGPNGAGKSTAEPALLNGTLKVTEFVNADTIAQGLSAFNPQGAAISAGRIMLNRLKELAAARESFAFETTGQQNICALDRRLNGGRLCFPSCFFMVSVFRTGGRACC